MIALWEFVREREQTILDQEELDTGQLQPLQPWPEGVVPYHINETIPQKEAMLIRKAMSSIEDDACVHFVEHIPG